MCMMKKIKEFVFLISFLLTGGLFVTGCAGLQDPASVGTSKLTDVSIPETIAVPLNSDISIVGQGFEEGYKLIFTSTNSGDTYEFPVNDVTGTGVKINIGENINSGTYKVTAVKGSDESYLGTTRLSLQAATTIPDIAGKNIKGIVYCNGKGIPNVVVSDGIEVTKTDANGIYYLASAKKHGYVFISIPRNYEVATRNKLPLFFQYLSSGTAVVEQRDFELYEVDNSNHVMILMADMHLANRIADISQFKGGFYPELSSYAIQLKNSGIRVYGLTLGDMSWDAFWYSNSYALPNYVNEIGSIGFQIFNAMGNHDNDPYKAGDFAAESTFKLVVGPSYYSFNIGKVHYIVLDDIEYVNADGVQGTIGTRDYKDVVSTEAMGWLAKDLAMITDKSTPIVVAFHIPMYAASVNTSGQQVNTVTLNNGTALKTAFSGFSKVEFFSGHTHINYNIEISSGMYEHNVAAVCATWWWTCTTGYAGNHLCKDGSPGGYGIFEVSDKNLKYCYKGIGYSRDQQFRSYDRNTIEITAAAYTPKASATYQAMVPTYAGEYAAKSSSNIVLINVFNYDSTCKLEVTENGIALPVTRKSKKDPLHIISYEMQRLNRNAEPTADFVTNNSTHIFQVTASSATSTLFIKLTDHNGDVYTETMTRPKDFNTSMATGLVTVHR